MKALILIAAFTFAPALFAQKHASLADQEAESTANAADVRIIPRDWTSPINIFVRGNENRVLQA